VGKTVFGGKAKRSEKKQREPEAEEGMEDTAPNSEVNVSGRARRQRGWYKRGVLDTKLNTVNMTAWVPCAPSWMGTLFSGSKEHGKTWNRRMNV
jgi:hypothetical protein